jgi:hypothetical protein
MANEQINASRARKICLWIYNHTYFSFIKSFLLWCYKTTPTSESSEKFAIEASLFFASLTGAIALANIIPANSDVGVAMTDLWHNTIIIALFFFIWAVIVLIRRKLEPRKKDIGDLDKSIANLTSAIEKLKESIDIWKTNQSERDSNLIPIIKIATKEALKEDRKEQQKNPQKRRTSTKGKYKDGKSIDKKI